MATRIAGAGFSGRVPAATTGNRRGTAKKQNEIFRLDDRCFNKAKERVSEIGAKGHAEKGE